MASRTQRALYASLLLITGCFSAGGGSCELFPPNGLAGNGSFNYQCVGSDPECASSDFELGAKLPSRPIARTASFGLTYVDEPTKSVKAASPNAVSGVGTFTALRSGKIGFFVEALDGTDAIEDAIRLEVADPDSVRIDRVGVALLGDSDKLVVGNEQRYRVAAFQKAERLAGNVPGVWSTDREDVVAIDTDRFGVVTLKGLAPGKVKLSMKAAGLDDAITIEVVTPSPGDEDAGIDGGADANDDGSTDASNDGGSTDASQD